MSLVSGVCSGHDEGDAMGTFLFGGKKAQVMVFSVVGFMFCELMLGVEMGSSPSKDLESAVGLDVQNITCGG